MTRRAHTGVLLPDAPDNIISVAELRDSGLSTRVIAMRCRPDGPWRKLMRGVIQLAPGEPTRRQLLRAAAVYLGGDGVLSGIDALIAHGLELPVPRVIHLLVPAHRRVLPPDFLHLERTMRPPDPVLIGGLPFAPAARAALDAARREHDPDTLRDLLALPVYYGLCTFDDLQQELDEGSQRGSAAVRAELRRLRRMRDTYVHGVARQLIRRAPLPPPRWHVTVSDLRGRPIGTVDAWWEDVGLGWRFSSTAAEDPGGQLAHLSLTAAGVVLVRTPPDRLRDDPDLVLRELASAFRKAATRSRPLVTWAAEAA
ncbi:hypothetical protein [Prauserella muralis]|uniref:Uncharacterized protein n=1 Tax=Prauserella muralis TaxID=588067 RepID=A0A2V4BB09_9PSEU|nr:hypothetical protein [Prauserella muralis]PXY32555.1 hypothetical protein BAY60_09940 [Prauserella muralis]TWE23732.1 hypothetical protein FHX69_5029 [Prauserella muralis]